MLFVFLFPDLSHVVDDLKKYFKWCRINVNSNSLQYCNGQIFENRKLINAKNIDYSLAPNLLDDEES